MKKITLKPCPFCGEHAELYEISSEDMDARYLLLGEEDANTDAYYSIECAGCGAQGAANRTADKTINEWNTRSNDKNIGVMSIQTFSDADGAEYKLICEYAFDLDGKYDDWHKQQSEIMKPLLLSLESETKK